MNINKSKTSVFNDIRKLSKLKNNDAFLLIFGQDSLSEEKINSLDLSSISEIKKDKDGGVTLKFCDKQSILENLLRFTVEEAEKNKSENFLKLFNKNTKEDI